VKITLDREYKSALGHQIVGWDAKGRTTIHCNSVKDAIQHGAEYVRTEWDGVVYRIVDRYVDRWRSVRVADEYLEWRTP
jgi:hypothetical protein